VLIIKRSNFIIQHVVSSHSVGGRPVHRRTGRPPTVYDDTRCCIIQFYLLMMSTIVLEHVQEYNKLILKQEFVHWFGQLLRLYWDARSAKHKKILNFIKLNFLPKLVICTAFICSFHKSGTALEDGQEQGISVCVIQCVTTLITLNFANALQPSLRPFSRDAHFIGSMRASRRQFAKNVAERKMFGKTVVINEPKLLCSIQSFRKQYDLLDNQPATSQIDVFVTLCPNFQIFVSISKCVQTQ